jgi:hypothetical protein
VNRHPRRKNNVQVNVMYELYLDGRSLSEIAAMYHKTRQAVWILMHQYVWEKHNGPILPKHVVRIVNGDKRDARIENLELLSLSDWNKRFCSHLNQFTSPTGSQKHNLTIRDRVRAERNARWARANAIG